ASASFAAALLVLLANLGVAIVLLFVPYLLVIAVLSSTAGTGNTLADSIVAALGVFAAITFSGANVVTALAAALVFLIGLLLVVDAVFWFIAERPVYAAARYGILQKKKALFAIGAALLGSG